MGYYDDNNYDCDNQSSNSEKDEHKKELEKLKKSDKGYNKVYRYKFVENPKTHRVKKVRYPIEFYTSGDTGTLIRDAESGHTYNYKVGSLGEHLFFKVSLSTGECKSTNNSNTLFFLSPKHYSEHFNVTLSDDIINSWSEKYDHYSKNITSTEKKSEESQQ